MNSYSSASVSRFEHLEEWLAWQSTLHPTEIELGLTRVRAVAQRLNLLQLTFPIVTVAGTNGKGSSVALLQAILSAQGYRVGCYTSPHIVRYNERIRIGQQTIADADLCRWFAKIEAARAEISLTYFEFGTLAAVGYFQEAFEQNQLDIAILEVGLGGRLDAVNVFEPSVGLVTTIDLDHQAWLGTTREAIGLEKAGIFRAGGAAVCADPQPPVSLMRYAADLQAHLHCAGRDFQTQVAATGWQWTSARRCYQDLPLPALQGAFQVQNAAGVLMTLELLQAVSTVKVSEAAIRAGLQAVHLAGRLQWLPLPFRCLADVAHNPQSVQALAAFLETQFAGQAVELHAIIGILKDKEFSEMLRCVAPYFAQWHVASLPTPRSASGEELAAQLQELGIEAVRVYSSIAAALENVRTEFGEDKQRVAVVFGSFYTVEAAMVYCESVG